MANEPVWLTELLDAAEKQEGEHKAQLSKVRCDQILQSIVKLESKVEEVNSIAEKEQTMVAEWQKSECGKIERSISWLSRQLEEFIRASQEKTIRLPFGTLSLRAGKAKVSIIDEAAFMQIAEKKGLVRIKPEEKLPDLLKIHEFIRVHGFPPAGCSYTPATVNFSFKTRRRNKMSNNRPKVELQLNQPIKSSCCEMNHSLAKMVTASISCTVP